MPLIEYDLTEPRLAARRAESGMTLADVLGSMIASAQKEEAGVRVVMLDDGFTLVTGSGRREEWRHVHGLTDREALDTLQAGFRIAAEYWESGIMAPAKRERQRRGVS